MPKLAEIWAPERIPAPANEESRAAHWERWRETAAGNPDPAVQDFARQADSDPVIRSILDAVFGNSPFLGRCMIRDPAFTVMLIAEGPDRAWARVIGEAGDHSSLGIEGRAEVMRRLRVAKRRAALTVALADILSVWPLERLTNALSDLAGAALSAGCRYLLRTLHDAGRLRLPSPEIPEQGSGLIVLGMGKLGGGELNYSSDIDIILCFDETVAPLAPGVAAAPTFTRLARDLVAIMQERTVDGYVFRTDLQLRPDPGSTALALSTAAAQQYYESAGRTWERAAMIKARQVAGDVEAGCALLEMLGRFVWRQHLDFAAAQDIRAIKQQINDNRGTLPTGDVAYAGHNIKLDRGGIREIEFFAQTQQLIWGGRDPALRDRRTMVTLDGLVRAGHLDAGTARDLADAYVFHRTVEHRLQMIEDQQTHSLPGDGEGIRRLAVFLGYADHESFVSELGRHIRTVDRHFQALFAARPLIESQEGLDFSDADQSGQIRIRLSDLGFADPDRVIMIIGTWFQGRSAASRTERARDLLRGLMPVILHEIAAMPDPDQAFLRLDRFLSRASSGVQLMSMLTARPALIRLVAEIMGMAPRLADWLTHQPLLLENVLSREYTALDVPDDIGDDPGVAEAARRGLVRLFYKMEFNASSMAQQLSSASEDIHDLLIDERRWANDSVFQVGMHMLRGLLSPVEAGRPLSDIADTCLMRLMPAIKAEFESVHGMVPGGRIAVIAFGKLGSREMTISSDLDLLFLYDHRGDVTQSDGRRPLAPGHYYSRMCRRLISAITAPTAEGKLYDVDMRLRPSGNAGPIACSLEAFSRYHESSAWTWEHQALTRARVVYGEHGLGENFDAITQSVLRRPRARRALAKDVADMRNRIRCEHGSRIRHSVKLRPGGLMEAEFIAQYLQLLHAYEVPGILAGDAVSVFDAAASTAVLDAGTARELADATRLWRNLQGILRLTTGQDSVGPDGGGDPLSVVERFYGTVFRTSFGELVEDTAATVAAHADRMLVPSDD